MSKRKKGSTPKYKRYNRAERLKAAKDWIKLYEGKNVVKGYSKHFAVDKLFAGTTEGGIPFGITWEEYNEDQPDFEEV